MEQGTSKLEASRQHGRHQVEEQRENMLAAAEALFLEKGLENTTMVDIAARAGITKVTLYRYFPNRDVIALEIHARMMDRIAAVADVRERNLSLEDTRKLVRSMIRNYHLLRDAYRYMGMFDQRYLDAPPDAALPRWTKDHLIALTWGGAALEAMPHAGPHGDRPIVILSTVIWFLEKLALRGELTWSDQSVPLEAHLALFEEMILGYIDRFLGAEQPSDRIDPTTRGGTMSTQVNASDFPEIRWKGHWIWVPEDKVEMGMAMPGAEQGTGQESHGLFRKTFTLDAVPARVPARITADSRYALYVNGQEVSRGPVRSQPRRMMYDLVDLAPALQAGENVIAVYCKYYGRPNSFYIPAVPNAGLGKTGALVFEADLGPAGWLVSDPSWKAHKSHAWDTKETAGQDMISGGVPVEQLDARRLPAGWKGAGFDDSGWEGAQVLRAIHIGGFARSQPPTDPYGPLYPRPIALLGGEVVAPAGVKAERLGGAVDTSLGMPAARVASALSLPAEPAGEVTLPLQVDLGSGGARLTIDFGRIVAGLVQLEVQAPAGTAFDMAYVEEPLTGQAQGMFGPHNGSRYIARGADDAFEAFDINGLRYIYLVVHGTEGPVTVERAAVREMIYPWTPGASFECSDPELNRLYQAGIRTVDLNSFDAFTDCPTREQRAWVGDSVVHQMVHLATNLDWRLAWQYLNLGSSPRYDGILPMSVAGEIEAGGSYTIPDWSLHWVHGVYNLYRFSGDRAKVKSYMPVVERVLRWYLPYQTAAGVLKDVVEWNLVDWGALFVEDTSSILTAIWARGLSEFAEMAAWLGEKASQAWAEGVYARAQAGYEMFWDEARGTYIDHIVDGVPQKAISQVAGALAVVSGLAPRARWARIVETVTDPERLVVRSWTGGESGEYSMEKMQKQFMGIYEADWDVEREIVIGQPFISYLVHDAVVEAGLAHKLPDLYRRWSVFLAGGYDTIGECWGWGTHVHGWSSTVTKDMVFYTLGVTPAEPGYAAARVAPRLGPLAWARGKVPTPFGLIAVDVDGERVAIDSPVPVLLDLEGKPAQKLPAGRHEVAIG